MEIQGFTSFTVTDDTRMCSGHRAPIAMGTTAYEDAEGWIWCGEAATQIAAEEGTDGSDPAEAGNPYARYSGTPGGWDGFTDLEPWER